MSSRSCLCHLDPLSRCIYRDAFAQPDCSAAVHTPDALQTLHSPNSYRSRSQSVPAHLTRYPPKPQCSNIFTSSHAPLSSTNSLHGAFAQCARMGVAQHVPQQRSPDPACRSHRQSPSSGGGRSTTALTPPQPPRPQPGTWSARAAGGGVLRRTNLVALSPTRRCHPRIGVDRSTI